MVTKKDIDKPAIIYVKEHKTGKMVWRNFGYWIVELFENGQVLLRGNNQPPVYFDAKDVRAIDL